MDEPYTGDACSHEHTFICAGGTEAGWNSGFEGGRTGDLTQHAPYPVRLDLDRLEGFERVE